MQFIVSKFTGEGWVQKALRGSAVTVLGFGTQQFLRLLSNILLAYLLFPEAFGIMALVTVVLTGLQQFSDVGIGQSIIQSDRGDDPVFRDTAWTIQIIRGVILYLIALALARPMAAFYDLPILAEILPVSALSVLIASFTPTNAEWVKRHLDFTRITLIDIGAQLVGLVVTVTLAYLLQSIWALVYGSVASSLVAMLAIRFLMPGRRDHFAFEWPAAVEIVHFGKWLFLATIANFLMINADKFLLGLYVTIDTLGIYNIGYFLSSFPLLLNRVVNARVLVPFYRRSHPSESRHFFLRARKMQLLTTGAMTGLVVVLMVLGLPIVDLLYDDRYTQAGIILVALAAINLPQIALQPYDQSILATGSSRDYFFIKGVKALVYVTCIMIGLELAGLLGAILAQGLAFLVSYPFVIYKAVRARVWDPVYDLIIWGVTAALWGITWLVFGDRILGLIVA